jgi:predicted GNAT family acetyltransferase
VSSLVRSLQGRDSGDLSRLVATSPAGHCFAASRLEAAAGDPSRLGFEAWGYEVEGRIRSAVFLGANVIPLGTDAAARAAFAGRMRLTGRRGSSLVGFADEVLDLWRLIAPSWGPAREVRTDQPLLVMDRESSEPVDPDVRPVRPEELDILLPACISMFTEEVGVSPVAGGAHTAYRARIAQLIREGRALAHIEDGQVLFKAEIGAVSTEACQVQGVWVAPSHRGRGLSTPGMAAVVGYALKSIAPMVSLYVNDFNVPARRTYERVGFTEAGRFATVLLP